MLSEDGLKLYDKFKVTINNDEQKGQNFKKMNAMVSREDKDILEC